VHPSGLHAAARHFARGLCRTVVGWLWRPWSTLGGSTYPQHACRGVETEKSLIHGHLGLIRAPRATVRASFSAGAPRRAVLQRPQRLAEPVCGPDVLAWTYHRPAVAHARHCSSDLAHLPPARGHLRALRKRLPSASWRRRAWHEEEPCPGRIAAARPISHGASSSWAPPRPRNVPRPASSQIGRSVPSTQINRYEVCRERPRTTRASQLILIAFHCRIGAAIRSPSPDRLAGGPPAP
jgi:hypothetical protein